MSTKMVHATLQKDLLLPKESASWVTKLLNEEMKIEGGRTCKAFIAIKATVLDHL
jgi:hypothetical protein